MGRQLDSSILRNNATKGHKPVRAGGVGGVGVGAGAGAGVGVGAAVVACCVFLNVLFQPVLWLASLAHGSSLSSMARTSTKVAVGVKRICSVGSVSKGTCF